MRCPSDTRITMFLMAGMVFVLGLVSGCVTPTVDSNKVAAPATYSVKAPSSDHHDVAIISVDFDPPLTQGRLAAVPLDKLALLVAVDNKGNKAETGLSVQAKLMGESEADTIESKSLTIDSLAPGEARVVKFTGFAAPARSSYFLKVEVQPISGEIVTNDNSKTIQLLAGPR
ncbi:MAG: hypothetical protein M1358_05830 [Chloroflexi bacterium]|nr:hypothetical protein [Chloroflexota bacterium]